MEAPVISRPRAHLLLLLALLACGQEGPSRVLLATTTSVEDSGLLDTLLPAFREDNPQYEIEYVAVGSGQALELGRRGDADVIFAHSPNDEQEFIDTGYGLARQAVMHNEFIVLGPPDDPAGIRGLSDATEAFRRIAADSAPFVSRGDDSGTHRKEQAIWARAGVVPQTPWYLEAGVGMGDALRIASERNAYILSDISTWLYNRKGLNLETLVQRDPDLVNRYSVIRVKDAKHPAGAAAFADWLISARAQQLIRTFGVEQLGQAIFVPDAPHGLAP
jgi:tungstate transport system substrate-binding protein